MVKGKLSQLSLPENQFKKTLVCPLLDDFVQLFPGVRLLAKKILVAPLGVLSS